MEQLQCSRGAGGRGRWRRRSRRREAGDIKGRVPLLVYRGQLACELLPAAIAADPGIQRAKLSVLGMITVPTFDFQSSRINRHVPVHVDVNDFLIGRVGERIEGSPTLAQVCDSRVSRHAFALLVAAELDSCAVAVAGARRISVRNDSKQSRFRITVTSLVRIPYWRDL